MAVKAAKNPTPRIGSRQRVAIEGVTPEIDGGAFAVRRACGEWVEVEADIFTDGHDELYGVLRYRQDGTRLWHEVAMTPLGNDRWRARFQTNEIGRYRYTVLAWVDPFRSWRRDLTKRIDAPQLDMRDLMLAFRVGAALVRAAAARAPAAEARRLLEMATLLAADDTEAGDADIARRQTVAMGEELFLLMTRNGDRETATVYKELSVWVERPRARFSAWYEFFPRACAPGRHARLADCKDRLRYVADLGFDVVYLPPIHPIGSAYRKGKNNSLQAQADDVGSPWAIGAAAGGHKSVHPELGTVDDLRDFIADARALNLEIALDIAFQCSPDHPYVAEHPNWFRRRPDGSIQYAENPPKKYQDIYPFDFESPDWRALWEELKDVLLFWTEQGVRIFRVDNPHTKPFPFWQWVIAEVKQVYPDVIFLAEAFTRPRVMQRLAKIGFTQSYTYFTWRNTKAELTEYFTELTQTPVREYFWPNAWPNTPDILHAYLQEGGVPAFKIRAVLAATLASNYGIYGPAYELADRTPMHAGAEEYIDSEKYQLREWNLEQGREIATLLQKLNRARREHPALQHDWSLRFHDVDNPQIICYSKRRDADIVIAVVNLDFRNRQSGWVTFDMAAMGAAAAHDLLSGASFPWQGARHYVELDPQLPAHVLTVEVRA